MLDEAENQLENGGPWMNPEAPVKESSENYGTEQDVANCPFFLKTGTCRFGDRCSRKHAYPTASPTLMIRGMFVTFGMEQSRRDDYDVDASLEHSEEELQESFIEFYHDVLPEFKSVGKVVQFKVCCNHEPHLRGNVYIQFDTEEQCKDALIKFNGRWYAGRQLHCEMCPVTRWKNAICGLFDRQKCPKGKHCNFLHVFRNPGHEFWEADRDLHMSPDRSVRGSHRDWWHSERYGDRSWRQRHCSRSPPRSERSHSRREDDRRRSRSRERRTSSQQQREDRWSHRSRYSDRRSDRYRSRSRDRSRSRSRDRERDRRRNRSRDKDREQKYCNQSEERDSKDKNTHKEERDRSRSTSRERNKQIREKSKNRSPEKPDENEKPPDDDDTKTRHRSKKHSKKSKKKSKKKHKKKSRLSEGVTSSGESEKEIELDEENVEKCSATSLSQDIKETELLQKNSNLDGSSSADGEKNCSPDVKSEKSDTEIQSELTGNDDICAS
ncbi:U2 small nuclear ribonucleoprotein auxiliary factor 35 kDa subunit-related protein 2 [Scomber scombrus]|uniref:U2 small nuclear ribonucleoprotein auxiliary factor 35 kDa subunit-related protein 2 n=1 Tax=Scomber scombrus TaxID=13677 RepID=UPI002DD89AC8|nr:U2 small nuclear ribonucleoprotein auxiliary factor 35 kDa subunit-related protein 2 [Scomber scombrus]